jgi:hypothetical protein
MKRLLQVSAFMVITALILPPVCLAQQPTTVYVYNHNNDTFDNCAEGFIWKQLGLLDPNTGRPGVRNGNNIVNPDDATDVWGAVITDAQNNVIGYRSANGTQEAYNVSSSATTAQAWARVAAGGTLHIVKHGMYYKDENDQQHNGGGIVLDGGEPYDGFGAGTGTGYVRSNGQPSGAYNLQPRPGANITMNINSCYSSNDPDDNGPITTVTQSATTVPGVAPNPMGHVPEVYTHPNPDMQGGTPEQRQTAFNALRAAASVPKDVNDQEAGRLVGQWVGNIPFSQQYSRVQAIIDAAVGAGEITLTLNYTKDETGGGGGGGMIGSTAYHHHPVQYNDSSWGTTSFYFGDTVVASLDIPLGSLSSPATFHINWLPDHPVAPPAGYLPASSAFDFETWTENLQLAQRVSVSLMYFGNPDSVKMFRYDAQAGAWVSPGGSPLLDEVNQILTEDTDTLGIFALFTPCCNHDGMRGDVNYDLGGPNVADLTFAVDYLFRAGPPPPCLEEADVNGDAAGPNVADLTYLVDYLFRGGPPPLVCP